MAPGAARTWSRVKRARNRYTVLNVTETIWCGFESETEKQRRVGEGNAVRCNLLILEREHCKGGRKPHGYDSPGH